MKRKLYLTVVNSIVIPALIVTSINTWVQWTDHWEHQSHEPPVSERKQYSYMNLRTKAYPWGNGEKVSPSKRGRGNADESNILQTLFWNDKYNYMEKE